MIDMQSSYPFMQSDTFCFSFLIVFDNVRYMQIITRWNSFAWMHTTCIRIASDLRQRANMKLGYCWSVSQSSPPTHLLAVHRTLKKPVLCEQSDSVTIDHPVRKLVSFIGWFKVKARLARSINAHVMWSCDPWHKKYLIWIMEIPKKEATIPTATTNDVKLQSPKHFYMLSSINDSLSLFLLLLSALGTSLLLLYHLVSKIKNINSIMTMMFYPTIDLNWCTYCDKAISPLSVSVVPLFDTANEDQECNIGFFCFRFSPGIALL